MSVARRPPPSPAESIALDNLAGPSSRGAQVDVEAQRTSRLPPQPKTQKTQEQRQRKIVLGLWVPFGLQGRR